MLPSIQKILYATDLSDNSRRAFSYAAGLSERYNAQMLILHVVEPINPNTYMQISSLMGESEWATLQMERDHKLTDHIMSNLRRFCQDMQSNFECLHMGDDDIMLRRGIPGDEIANLAEEKGVDIIVMGTHGYGLVKDALMGGTVRRLVRQCQIPVLVVPSPEIGETA
jgi:nucleotide-binding universal stress UspA family protein